jgi:hypothetical protein
MENEIDSADRPVLIEREREAFQKAIISEIWDWFYSLQISSDQFVFEVSYAEALASVLWDKAFADIAGMRCPTSKDCIRPAAHKSPPTEI